MTAAGNGEVFRQQMANLGQLVGNLISSLTNVVGSGDSNEIDEKLLALHQAIEESEPDKVQEAIKDGAEVDKKFSTNINPAHAGITPLGLACAKNKFHIVKILLENGANVNLPYAMLNTTPLMTAAHHGNADIVKLLLERGANVNAVDLQQSTCLGYAFGGTQHLGVIRMLLDAKVDVNRKSMMGMTALLLVAAFGDVDLVSMVLEAGADPLVSNDFAHSALHLVVCGKREKRRSMGKYGKSASPHPNSISKTSLDNVMREWARVHKKDIGGSAQAEEMLQKAGEFMAMIGVSVQDDLKDDDQDAAMKKAILAVMEARRQKRKQGAARRKPGLKGLLSCAGDRNVPKCEFVNRPLAPEAKQNRSILFTPLDSCEEEEDEKETELDTSLDPVSKVTKSFLKITRMLLKAGCDVNACEKSFNLTALDMAMIMGEPELAGLLIGAGADPEHLEKHLASMELYEAIASGDKKEVKGLLFDEGVCANYDVSDVHIRESVHSRDDELGLNFLTVAVRRNFLDIAKTLIKAGANVNLCGRKGLFPLVEAARTGNCKVAELLLSSGANINQKCSTFGGVNSLVMAVRNKNIQIVSLLIKRGGFVDADCPLSSAIAEALSIQDEAITECLLRAKLESNFMNKESYLAKLSVAFQSGEKDMKSILQISPKQLLVSDQGQYEADTLAKKKVQPQAVITADVTQNVSKVNTTDDMEGLDITQNTTYYDIATSTEFVTSAGKLLSHSTPTTTAEMNSRNSEKSNANSQDSYRQAVSTNLSVLSTGTSSQENQIAESVTTPNSLNNNTFKKTRSTTSLTSRKETTL